MGPPGFEPGLEAPEAFIYKVNTSEDCIISTNIIPKFKEFCEIDLQLSPITVRSHLKNIKRFVKWLNGDSIEVEPQQIRSYLSLYLDKSPNTYANQIKSLRRFYRDFLKRGYIVESFKLPKKVFKPKNIPSKQDIQRFYNALTSSKERALFLVYASSGLRRNEVLSLMIDDLDFDMRSITPRNGMSGTKNTWVSFYNSEAEVAISQYLNERLDSNPKLFRISTRNFQEMWYRGSKVAGVCITPKVLREWFATEMGRLGVPDRYVDAFCGRVPKSVLGKHYTDYSPEALKKIYDKAAICIL